MANQSELRGSRSIGRESEQTERARMKTGYGRESVGRPDETGIRRGGQGPAARQTDLNTDQGPSSRQTSSAQDMAGQV